MFVLTVSRMHPIAPIIRLVAELVPSLALGLWIGRARPHWTRPLATPLVRYGVPVSVMGLLLKGGLSWNLAGMALTAALAIALPGSLRGRTEGAAGVQGHAEPRAPETGACCTKSRSLAAEALLQVTFC